MKELTTLITNLQDQKRRKRIIFYVHVVLVSHVYISIFMGV